MRYLLALLFTFCMCLTVSAAEPLSWDFLDKRVSSLEARVDALENKLLPVPVKTVKVTKDQNCGCADCTCQACACGSNVSAKATAASSVKVTYTTLYDKVLEGQTGKMFVDVPAPKTVKGLYAEVTAFDGLVKGEYTCYRENGYAVYRPLVNRPVVNAVRSLVGKDTTGLHSHLCSCGFEFWHGDGSNLEHKCPNCGQTGVTTVHRLGTGQPPVAQPAPIIQSYRPIQVYRQLTGGCANGSCWR